jgi:uncharacterized protein YpiB (UPF0302 family)
MDPIRQLWNQAKFKTKFTPPNILYAFNKTGERFIVLDDHRTIFHIMNSQGQIFVIAHFRCVKDPTNQYYICDDPMHIISCTKPDTEVEQYANDVIRVAVFVNK